MVNVRQSEDDPIGYAASLRFASGLAGGFLLRKVNGSVRHQSGPSASTSAVWARRRAIIAASRSGSRAARFVAAQSRLFALPAHAEAIQWETVGDPGNVADTTGSPSPAGTVGYAFKIMTFEWTNSQYVDFLNAVDPDGTNPNSVYNGSMGSNARGGISFTSGAASGSKYAVRSNMGAPLARLP